MRFKKNSFVIKTFLSFMMMGFIFGANTYAQEENELTLTIEQAVELAQENSPSLKSAQIDYELKQWKNTFAWNVFLPTVQTSATLSRANEVNTAMSDTIARLMHAPAKATTESDHWSAIANLSFSLGLNAAQIQSMRATHSDFESGKITWDQTCKETEVSIRKLFYGLLLQQENLSLQKTSLENAKQRQDQAQVNYNNGYVPELSLLQAQVAYENLRPNVEKMEQVLNQQLGTFAFLLGLPIGTKISLDGQIAPKFISVDAEELINDYLEQNLKIRSLRQSLNTLKIQKSALDLQAYTPSLSLGWSTQPVVSNALEANWFKKDNRFDNGSLTFTLAWNITNMLPFSTSRQQAKEMQSNLDKMQISLKSLQDNTELEIRTAIDNLNQSKRAIESSQRSISLAQRSFDMTSVAYRNGTKELLELREAETQLNQAKLGLANEEYNYISNLLDLEYKLDIKFEEEDE